MWAAKDRGADAALIVLPYYNRPNQAGLIAHFAKLVQSCDLPIVVYNVPGRTVTDITAGDAGRARQAPQHRRHQGRLRQSRQGERAPRSSAARSSVQLSGNDDMALGFNAMGGTGCISVTANVAPRLCADFQNAMLSGDWQTALTLQDKLYPLHAALFSRRLPGPDQICLEPHPPRFPHRAAPADDLAVRGEPRRGRRGAGPCRADLIVAPDRHGAFALAGLMLLAIGCRERVAGGNQARDGPRLRATSGAPGPADLVRAYPDHVASVDATQVALRNGTRLPISDGIANKTPAERIRNPDLDDMFAQPYRPGRPSAPPAPDEDPGRARYEPFFDQVYGDCQRGEVTPRLRAVRWMPSRGGTTLMVNRENGVADRLEAVIRDLERLPPAYTRYLVPAAGTYNCRVIAGTSQRSMHAYGVAIDINVALSDYWRWAGGEGAPYRNRIPWEIVADLRAARLHLGRQMGPFRHDALRISAGADAATLAVRGLV